MVDTENRILQLTSKHNGLDFDLSKTALGIQWQRYYLRQKQAKSRITFIEKKSLQRRPKRKSTETATRSVL